MDRTAGLGGCGCERHRPQRGVVRLGLPAVFVEERSVGAGECVGLEHEAGEDDPGARYHQRDVGVLMREGRERGFRERVGIW